MRSFTNTTIAHAETSICFGSSAPSTTLPSACLHTDIPDAGSPIRQLLTNPDVIVAVADPQNPNDIVPSPQPHAARAACSAPKAKPPTATRRIKKPETGELVTQASNAKRARIIADTILDLAARGVSAALGDSADVPRFAWADPAHDRETLTRARNEACKLLGLDPGLRRRQHRPLVNLVRARFGEEPFTQDGALPPPPTGDAASKRRRRRRR